MRFALILSGLAAAVAWAAGPAVAAGTDFSRAGPPSGKSSDSRGGARPADPLANLKPHEERRYRMELDECAKEAGRDRRVCERIVRRDAEAKSRRRGMAAD